jgi:hypothetical protein
MAVTNQGRGLVMKLSIIDSKPRVFLVSSFGMSCTGMKCASFAVAVLVQLDVKQRPAFDSVYNIVYAHLPNPPVDFIQQL